MFCRLFPKDKDQLFFPLVSYAPANKAKPQLLTLRPLLRYVVRVPNYEHKAGSHYRISKMHLPGYLKQCVNNYQQHRNRQVVQRTLRYVIHCLAVERI